MKTLQLNIGDSVRYEGRELVLFAVNSDREHILDMMLMDASEYKKRYMTEGVINRVRCSGAEWSCPRPVTNFIKTMVVTGSWDPSEVAQPPIGFLRKELVEITKKDIAEGKNEGERYYCEEHYRELDS